MLFSSVDMIAALNVMLARGKHNMRMALAYVVSGVATGLEIDPLMGEMWT